MAASTVPDSRIYFQGSGDMKVPGRISIFAVALAGAVVALSTPAWAPGSLGLDEVLKAVKGNHKLVAEIKRELKKNGLPADKVICEGARFGHQWKYLGGGRAAPYSCVIGKHELTIDAKLTFYDAKGHSLGSAMNDTTFAKAKTFRETHFKWKWAKPKD
ncbi:MAG: hypothetical protein P8Y71_28295 [Pseudolabrys sp.]